MGQPISTPTSGPDDWRWLLAKPGLHWKQGASAKSLADAWEVGDPWPPAVRQVLRLSDGLGDPELLVALPEHQTRLDTAVAPSQSDLLVLARTEGGLIVLAVEGKAQESFGPAVQDWSADGSAGKAARLGFRREQLGRGEVPGSISFRLLHQTASALIEARRFDAATAVMLVHSFHSDGDELGPDAWFDDFRAFAQLFGADVTPGVIADAGEVGGIRLKLGWVSDVPWPAAREPTLGARFDQALQLARRLHATQLRKGIETPYVSHLLGVAALVIEDGGSEDEAIAALLHDAVEDQGGQATLDLIRQQFGEEVAGIVEACSDSDVIPKLPWRERKEAYIAHLSDASSSMLRVSPADKLYNARAILFDHRAGSDGFARFSASREETRWYYESLARAFEGRIDSPMVAELKRAVAETYDDPAATS